LPTRRSPDLRLPADEHRVGAPAEVLEDAELVVDLRAARDEHEGALDLAEEQAEMAQLLFQEQAGVRRKEMGDRLGRGVRAVRRPECVVDVEVAAVRKLAGEALVVLRLPRVEARVLEDAD